MSDKNRRHRIYAVLLFCGAGLLLFRTITMLYQGAVDNLQAWVVILLIVELVLDASAMALSLVWAISLNERHGEYVYRVTAAIIIVHAIRVAVFVLGRTGPWYDFDVRPEARALHATRWDWGGVWFAGVLSTISVLLLVAFWRYRRSKGN